MRSQITRENFFPREIRFGKLNGPKLAAAPTDLHEAIKLLRADSKQAKGHGYVIEFRETNTRMLGKQELPAAITFQSREDYLKYLDKEKEFVKFQEVSDKILSEFPQLRDWMLLTPVSVIENFHVWDSLLKVCRYFVASPKPNLYIRQLPIEVHTKFIEENEGIIRQLLDVLIKDFINKGEASFEKRFHLQHDEPLIRFRVLDPILIQGFGGMSDISIPESQFRQLEALFDLVFILENKMTFLAVPDMPRAIAIFGKGFTLSLLKNVHWLGEKEIFYWGDLDVHGLQILSQLRGYFPHTISILMDMKTFSNFEVLAVDGPSPGPMFPQNLTQDEMQVYQFLAARRSRNRLEQEKISHAAFLEALAGILS